MKIFNIVIRVVRVTLNIQWMLVIRLFKHVNPDFDFL
jgi:hypothetical protein